MKSASSLPMRFDLFFTLNLIFLLLLLSPQPALAVCSESNSGSYLVCEDWDSDTPPSPNWPCLLTSSTGTTCGATWHGWTPSDTTNNSNTDSIITTAYAQSGTKSLRETSRKVGPPYEGPATDITHSISGNPTKVYVRFYAYWNKPPDTDIGVHLLFLNTSSSAQIALDIRNAYGNGSGSNIHYAPDGSPDRYFIAHTYTPTESFYGSNWNMNAHNNEWTCIEWMVDVGNNLTSLWINNTAQVSNQSVQWNTTNIHHAIWSAWRICGSGSSCPDTTWDIWMDNFVVSTSKVGCLGAPPTYTVGGSVSGIHGTVTLRNNGSDTISRSANGSFTFPAALNNNATFNVTVATQPAGQLCAVANGSGTISSADVTNVSITCNDIAGTKVPSSVATFTVQ